MQSIRLYGDKFLKVVETGWVRVDHGKARGTEVLFSQDPVTDIQLELIHENRVRIRYNGNQSVIAQISVLTITLVPDVDLTGKIAAVDSGISMVQEKNSLRHDFELAIKMVQNPHYLVVAVQLPNGAIELITNTHSFDEKFKYYLETYDDQFRHKQLSTIQIISFMLV